MYRSRTIALGLTVLFLASPGIASAECQRTGSLICGNGVPRIASAAPFEVSRGGDFSAAASGSTFKVGDSVLIGASNATLSLGSACQAAVGAGSLVSVRGSGSKNCVSVTEQAMQVRAQAADVDTKVNPLIILGVAGAGAVALAVGLALSNNGGNGGGNNVTVSSQ